MAEAPMAARNRCFSATPSRSGSTRGGSSASITTRANRVSRQGLQPARQGRAKPASSRTSRQAPMPQAPRHADEIDAALGVARLHAGLAIDAVVEHDDREVAPASGCRWWRATPSPISISPSPVMTATRRSRLRQRQAEPDHGGAAHGAPQVEIAVVVAGGGEILGGRAEAGHDQQIVAALGEQRGHGGAALELRASFGPHLLADQLLRQQHGDDALVAERLLHGALGRAGDLVRRCARDRPPPRTA